MKDASVRRPPQIVRAALDGAVATAVMSVPMLLRWLLQPDQPPPPKVVAENVQRRIGIAPEQRSPLVRQATWLAAHVLFGGALGIAGARWPSATPRRFALTYGTAAWTVNYGLTLPRLGLYPRLPRDDAARAVDNYLSHITYAAALARARPA